MANTESTRLPLRKLVLWGPKDSYARGWNYRAMWRLRREVSKNKNNGISLVKKKSVSWTNTHGNKMCLSNAAFFYTNVKDKWGPISVYFTRYHCKILISQVENQQWVCDTTCLSLFPLGSCVHIPPRQRPPLLNIQLPLCSLGTSLLISVHRGCTCWHSPKPPISSFIYSNKDVPVCLKQPLWATFISIEKISGFCFCFGEW